MLSRVKRRPRVSTSGPSRRAMSAICSSWYDFVVFAFLAPVIGARFFPSADALSGLI